jgi:L-ribulose-5-phosphate 3-epimerase UlaE
LGSNHSDIGYFELLENSEYLSLFSVRNRVKKQQKLLKKNIMESVISINSICVSSRRGFQPYICRKLAVLELLVLELVVK